MNKTILASVICFLVVAMSVIAVEDSTVPRKVFTLAQEGFIQSNLLPNTAPNLWFTVLIMFSLVWFIKKRKV